ncbi:MAG: FAD binding domain-containing protein [Burkholderiales bacterium]
MIPFNFEYYKPDSLKEAVTIFSDAQKAGLKPFYYGGGTEIITMSRLNSISPDVVIDIKGIPECSVFGMDDNKLVIGAGITLSAVKESNLFPLLGEACGRIADHTVQDKITIGGNICGTIIYRESLLPLFLSNAEVAIAGPNELYSSKAVDAFNNGKRLKAGELLVSIAIDKEFLNNKYWHIKKVSAEKIGYPLVSVSALSHQGLIKMAFSGVCGFPFIVDGLDYNTSMEEAVNRCIQRFPSAVLNDTEGSSAYREFVLRDLVLNILST